nr:hypothetical protein [Klebsormidium flaccidum]WKT07026.1 hypothetical protein [Klebsormidium flaccidum]
MGMLLLISSKKVTWFMVHGYVTSYFFQEGIAWIFPKQFALLLLLLFYILTPMSNSYSTLLNELCQSLPIGLVIPLKEWFRKEINRMQWNAKDSLDAIKKAFSTESKAFIARDFYRSAFARLAVYDGCIAVRMSVTVVAKCKFQTKSEYEEQFDYFEGFDNDLTNSREMRIQKPVLYKAYELTENFNLHRHYVTFLKDDFTLVKKFCQLVANTLKRKRWLERSGNILIELPHYYKDFLVGQQCIKPYKKNRWIWHNQQDLPQGRKLSIAFKEVYDKEDDAVEAIKYAAKGERLRKLALSIGENDSLKNYDSDRHEYFQGLYKYACEILLKKENDYVEPDEPPDKSYITHLALTALCSAHKKKVDYLTPNY